MLWTDDIDRTTSVFTVKLGFQVRPGDDFGDGVANRLLRTGDGSYIELLYTTRARAELTEGTRKDLDALRTGTGARTFAVHPLDLDELDAHLRKQGFDLDPPSPPSDWRSVSFAKSPVTFGDLFFIGYAEEHLTPLQLEDRARTRTHPNGTRAWTSIWLLSTNLAADRKALERAGFVVRGDVDMPQMGASGTSLEAGPDAIVLLAPKGEGIAARALANRGTHVIGLSLGVEDVERAKRLVQRGYGIKLERYAGLEGDSILAPTYGDLGLMIEFHAMAVPR